LRRVAAGCKLGLGEMEERVGGANIGEALHDTRRRRRISLDRAAQDTLIRLEHLKRLEAGDLAFLSPVYIRAFLREYATYLRLDPEPLLAALEELPDSNEAHLLAEEVRRSQHPVSMRQFFQGVAVVAAFAWIVFLLSTLIGEPSPDQPRAPAAAAAAEEEPASKPDAKASDPAGSDDKSASPTDVVEVEILASEARCWIEVVSDGRVVFSGTLEVGDSQTFEAKKDMTLSLGFPAGIEMTVNGIDLGAPGGDEPLRLALPNDLKRLRSRT